MAIGKKTGGKNFEKGHPPTPGGGRPRVPEDVKLARQMNKEEFTRLCNKYVNCGADELKAIMKDPTTPAIVLIVVQILAKGIQHGDDRRLRFFLDYMIGKPTENLNVSGEINLHAALVDTLEQIEKNNKKGE